MSLPRCCSLCTGPLTFTRVMVGFLLRCPCGYLELFRVNFGWPPKRRFVVVPDVETIIRRVALMEQRKADLAAWKKEYYAHRERPQSHNLDGGHVYSAIVGEPYRGSLYLAPDLNRLTGVKVA